MYTEFQLYSDFIHGTHVAGIAVRGNPAARLVVFRFNDSLAHLKFAPTLEWARLMADNFRQIGDYCRIHHVRVVNMSWGDEPTEFEEWLSRSGKEQDPVARKERALHLFQIWKAGISDAIKRAPDTLFICAAGNANADAGFKESAPASLHFKNLIAVGAVNQAGDETLFTNFGDTVIIDADGSGVESYVPGGSTLKLSGTSMAAPNVANLAAKLFAIDPSLTPERVIALIEEGASKSDDGRRHLIDEKQPVVLLQQGAHSK
jgi:subtilisin family serine protease